MQTILWLIFIAVLVVAALGVGIIGNELIKAFSNDE